MPEGDTVHKIANYLRPRLAEKRLVPFDVSGMPRTIVIADDMVESVGARGKHLMIQFASNRTMRIHLGMYGTWHHYRSHVTWERRRRSARIVLATQNDVFVCFRPTKVDLIPGTKTNVHPLHHDLGPDLITSPIQPRELSNRVHHYQAVSPRLDDLLLDQRVAAGIGNVYKSELAFVFRLHPATPVFDIADEILFAMFECASELLRYNLRGGPRQTTHLDLDVVTPPQGPLWVYGRKGQSCFRCGTAITSAFTGRHHRVTYWCEGCQRLPDAQI